MTASRASGVQPGGARAAAALPRVREDPLAALPEAPPFRAGSNGFSGGRGGPQPRPSQGAPRDPRPGRRSSVASAWPALSPAVCECPARCAPCWPRSARSPPARGEVSALARAEKGVAAGGARAPRAPWDPRRRGGRVCHCPGDGPRRPPPPYGPESPTPWRPWLLTAADAERSATRSSVSLPQEAGNCLEPQARVVLLLPLLNASQCLGHWADDRTRKRGCSKTIKVFTQALKLVLVLKMLEPGGDHRMLRSKGAFGFQHPVRLYLPISKRQEYLQSSGEKVLASFPVQATIHFYNDASDSEDGEQEDGAQAPRLQSQEAQGPPEHGAGAQGRGQPGNGGARSGGSSGHFGGVRPHHRQPPGAGECSSAQ
ncbi:protein ripply3 [Dasypus novemcinctus]|uniref:protein ripply3 n=1 Tax=Dasypus novemcinctus TaxID=9361 RepID=UPI00265DEE48|nr:protein ripply3 [Dasypus novemcinctus]